MCARDPLARDESDLRTKSRTLDFKGAAFDFYSATCAAAGCSMGVQIGLVIAVMMTIMTMTIKVEQVEQVADGRHVARHVGVVAVPIVPVGAVIILNGIGQVITAAIAQLRIQ
jgi:hypothetical protein